MKQLIDLARQVAIVAPDGIDSCVAREVAERGPGGSSPTGRSPAGDGRQRGEAWGEEVSTPLPDASSHVRRRGRQCRWRSEGRPVVVRGGDLHRSLGAPSGTPDEARADRLDRGGGRRAPLTAVAHVVVRRRGRLGWWRGPSSRCSTSITSDHGTPLRGPIPTTVGSTWSRSPNRCRCGRWQAWRRVRTGDHVPHPDITTAPNSLRNVVVRQTSRRVGRRGRLRDRRDAGRRDRARRRRDLRVVGLQRRRSRRS